MKQQELIRPTMAFIDKVQLVISYIVRFSLLIAAAVAIYAEQWPNVYFALLGFILTFLPAVIERNHRVYLPGELEIITIFFIYASLYLGEANEYYTKFWWWDSMLHAISGIILGSTAFIIAYILNTEEKISFYLRPKFLSLFAFTFALSMGALWEIFEFVMDSTFKTNMLKTGIDDTMFDLISDSLGALLTSVIGYFYITRQKMFLLNRLIERFVKQNSGRLQKFKYRHK